MIGNGLILAEFFSWTRTLIDDLAHHLQIEKGWKRHVALFKGFPLQVTPFQSQGDIFFHRGLWWHVMWIFTKATRPPYTFHTTRVTTSLRIGSFQGPRKSWLRVVWSLGDRGKTQHLGLRLSPVVCFFEKDIFWTQKVLRGSKVSRLKRHDVSQDSFCYHLVR